MQLPVDNMALKINTNIVRTIDSFVIVIPPLTDTPVAIVEIKSTGYSAPLHLLIIATIYLIRRSKSFPHFQPALVGDKTGSRS